MLEFIIEVIFIVLRILSILVPLIIAIAYMTLLERKVISGIQRRKGPNVVGFWGLLQPLADGVKLLLKETVMPNVANKYIFVISPILTLFLSLMMWAVISLGNGVVIADLEIGVLYIFAVSSLGVYGVLMAGWSSNSRYAFLGCIRSAAQMVSYEVSIGLIVMNVILCVSSLNLNSIVMFQRYIWFIVPLYHLFIMFFVSALAETNRPPFDLPEAEAELVAGYNVEYSSMGFALFFLGEYGNIILMCFFTALLFLGGWYHGGIFLLMVKVSFLLVLFIWVRGALPRYRYDQLMRLGWKVYLPLSLGFVINTSGILLGLY